MTHRYYVVNLILRPREGTHDLLMGLRAPGRYMGGTWQLISGGLEEGETGWQAALREMREETSLAPVEFYRLSTLTQFYAPLHDTIFLAPMFCSIVPGDARVTINDEHTDYAWLPLADADARLMWPSDRTALREVIEVILGNAPAKPHMRIQL